MSARFRHFAAIDWSGAAGERHRGIAVALCGEGHAAPTLVRPGHRWSRGEVLDWLVSDLPADTLVGFDMGISLAHADAGQRRVDEHAIGHQPPGGRSVSTVEIVPDYSEII